MVTHIVRMMPCRTLTLLLYGRVEGRRPVGRPRKCWLDVVGEDCKLLGITLQEADQLARNRVLWSRSVYRLLERADSSASSKL